MPAFPVAMPMRPALWRSGDKLYAIGGVAPVQVPADTTMATLGQYAIHMPGVSDSTGEVIEVEDRWIVEGSKGNKYTVTKIGDAFKCSCPGFSFRRKCKHSEKISKEVN